MLFQKLTEFFYSWEVRIGIILSMSIQIILVFLGPRRKISNATWLKILVWCAYMSADSVSATSLAVLTRDREGLSKEDPSQNPQQLHLLWVPFLILHHGGPETITAYSLEDNNLWLRHLLNLVTQIGVAVYAIKKSWNIYDPLTFLVIPIFVWGVVKYCERIWALKSASLENLSNHYLPETRIWPSFTFDYFANVCKFIPALAYVFADKLALMGEDLREDTISTKTAWEAFRFVEDVLGLLYDLLYTKALLIYSRLGIFLRCVYLVTSIATLISFAIIHKYNKAKWSQYPLADVLITYFLMIGAVILEIYGIIWVLLSEWTLAWLHWGGRKKLLFQNISRALFGEKRWSRSIKQHNILKHHWIPDRKTLEIFGRRRKSIQDVFPFQLLWDNIDIGTFSDMRGIHEMREMVFKVIKEKCTRYYTEVRGRGRKKPSEYLSERGDEVLQMYGCLEEFRWSTTGIGFDQSLFIWHIATSLCYYPKYKIISGSGDENDNVGFNSNAKTSRYISDYFMYLARFRPKMLPPGDYSGIYMSVSDFFFIYFDATDEDRNELLQTALEPLSEARHEKIFRPAYMGIKLAVLLSNLETKRRWEIISGVWAHMLCYAAATQHVWEEHAQQLRRGGEFITHVAVLMVHAFLSEQVSFENYFPLF